MSSHIVPVTGTIQTVISSIINNCTSITVEQQLADHLDRIPITERLGEVQNLLLTISEADASIAEDSFEGLDVCFGLQVMGV